MLMEREQRWRQEEDEAARRRVDEERKRQRQHRASSQMSDAEQQQQQMHAQSSAPRTVPPSTRTVEAASVLQRHFRIRQSIRSIKSLTSDFNTLRRKFTYPSTISFQKPSSPPTSNDVINVPAISTHPDDATNLEDASIPKLAFNSTNYDLRAYIEALDKLLVKLDGVESWGDPEVRTRRRAVVKRIEEEQVFLERFWKTSWLKHIEEQGEWVDGDMPMGEEALV
ncbi:hypothetical protein AN958_01261 [Leucoagaricus sp. SymC.cos]|nr:hypothetical protein AN958_01261 [Leucoagaricus sp. SymC.cos]